MGEWVPGVCLPPGLLQALGEVSSISSVLSVLKKKKKPAYFVLKNGSYEHNNDVIMGTMASQITSLTIVYSTVYSGADQRKYQSSASLAFVWGIHRGPVNSPHKWLVTRKMFPFDDVIMNAVGVLQCIYIYIVFKTNNSPVTPGYPKIGLSQLNLPLDDWIYNRFNQNEKFCATQWKF